LLLATGRKAQKAKGTKVVTLASFAFALQKSKAKVAQRAKGLRVILLLLRRNITFAFGYRA
jgi:hypothetical protein